MVLTTDTIKRRYKNGGTGGKKGRPHKKEHWRAREKRLKMEAAAAREAQTSKLRSSANVVTHDIMDVDNQSAVPDKPPRARNTSARKAPPIAITTRARSRHCHPASIRGFNCLEDAWSWGRG